MTRDALGQLYAQYGYLVHRRCAAILGNSADANDALQETFLRVDRYGPPAEVRSMLAWLNQVAARVCIDQLQQRRRNEKFGDQVIRAARELVGLRPNESLEGQVSFGQVLTRLDSKSREIAVLRYLEGLTQEEVAERTGYTRRTVYTKLKNIEEKLSGLLDELPQVGGIHVSSADA